MKYKFSLVPVSKKDLPEIEKKYNENNMKNYLGRFSPFESEKVHSWDLIAVEGRIVGTVWLIDMGARTLKLGIFIWQNEFRGKGLGSTVIFSLINKSQSEGFEKIFLNVRKSNRRALYCYEGAGFTWIGENLGEKDGEKFAVVQMEKLL